jgi:hypothetical protein
MGGLFHRDQINQTNLSREMGGLFHWDQRNERNQINQISHTIAHRELKQLVERGVFRKKGAGKYIRYELTQGDTWGKKW